MAKHSSGAHKHGPILSPMTDVEEIDRTGEGTIHNVPGYPEGSKDKTDPVIFDECGNFDKAPSPRK